MAQYISKYDIIVIGSGLAGMTAANTLAKSGHKVLLLEKHHKLGGLATWFRRQGGYVFDVSLHGFPVGMIKSCRRYWNAPIADRIVPLPRIVFDNPQFTLTTSFNREDFTRLLTQKFHLAEETVVEFFDTARAMSHTGDASMTTQQLFDRFFPGREDVIRLLMEPITYANGSTLEDPALTYGIVFSNFMSKGVYTFEGGTDLLIRLMQEELERNGVDIKVSADVTGISVENGEVRGVQTGKDLIRAKAVVSNTNLKGTIFHLVGREHFTPRFIETAEAVRLNNSSTQVYMGLKPGESINEDVCGDLLFCSAAPAFRTEMLLSRQITSRTFSFYYPKTRPGTENYAVVSSTNANYSDWADLPEAEYKASKEALIEDTLNALEKYVPGIRGKIGWLEAATPCTFQDYTSHWNGASFGTKYEGLAVSRELPEQIQGLFHTGSVGIIMSGWLGAVNYGFIVANNVDAFMLDQKGKN
ncbi:MAG: NAD(P)/FAD-dependent oxidoreductase [Planctomycetaceae bacterium]|jgi:phytoene dehydrogenase-like protein|nr:NAD(P)/FAD-dependent oxidoreductase [Planctomycetaceae bacterium]